MTITAIAVTKNNSSGSLQIPRPLAAAVAVDTNDAKGIALTQSDGIAAIVTLTGSADWTWSDVDGVAAADGQKVPSGVPYPVQCTPGKTQNFYIKTATTANIVATIIA